MSTNGREDTSVLGEHYSVERKPLRFLSHDEKVRCRMCHQALFLRRLDTTGPGAHRALCDTGYSFPVENSHQGPQTRSNMEYEIAPMSTSSMSKKRVPGVLLSCSGFESRIRVFRVQRCLVPSSWIKSSGTVRTHASSLSVSRRT